MTNNENNNQEVQEKEAVAKLRRVRIAPRKSRLIADMVRESNVEDAEAQLLMSPRRASDHILKLLKSAVANATHNHDMKANKLYIKEIRVDEGPTYKRWMPRAFGRATPIHKKTSHIHITLGESEEKESEPTYVIPDKSKDKDEKDQDQKQDKDGQKDQPVQPTQAQKPTEGGQSGGGLRRMFRRKSGM